jgi:hypothetical protein
LHRILKLSFFAHTTIPMQLTVLALSLAGALLSVAGWAIERAFRFEWLRRLLCPKADIALRALDALRANPKLGFTHDDPAFVVLASVWPRFPHTLGIHAIGRTVAFVEFGPEVKNQIGLTLFDQKLNRIEGYDWTFAAATDALIAPTEKRFRYVGTTVFIVGITLTVVVAILRFASSP